VRPVAPFVRQLTVLGEKGGFTINRLIVTGVAKTRSFFYTPSMKYLLYTLEGFSKKFPLYESFVKIGRDEANDLVIDNDYISRRHVDIYVKEDSILVKDAGSSNGFFVNNRKRKKAEIGIGQSFDAGEVKFTLENGDTTEFSLSEKFQPGFFKEKERKKVCSSTKNHVVTRSLQTINEEIEESIFKWSLRFENFDEFISYLTSKLTRVPGFGSLFLVENGGKKENAKIRFSVNGKKETFDKLKKILKQNTFIFREAACEDTPDFCSAALSIKKKTNALVYFFDTHQLLTRKSIKNFLLSLSKEIEMMDKFIEEQKHLTRESIKVEQIETEIITNNDKMKNLIRQAKKIADSDIYILIQGESGTGKELFARLIHRCSKRDQGKFVALNCAAIPENLLESELFGYEKGSFTGAYKSKKGKLEMASGGTLVLDEIGDMPLNLQVKLLRAIQEHEFYSLGGSIPIKVNLRIISITHQNLEEHINDKKFREDLYYRLVHLTLRIPPLRERKEDIPPLINFFTNKFCRQRNRSINGYSVKAFEALVNYNWRGNVRQLENEINSIVNLTDDGETITFDILSDKIIEHYRAKQEQEKALQEQPGPQPVVYHRKPGLEDIVEVLKRNGWNKSKSAKELNMTYHGLHKKMKKMGITPPKP
jgi:transcriptional regulator with PAS, ATPase and Fis domain